mgnify:CR=1 FL=1
MHLPFKRAYTNAEQIEGLMPPGMFTFGCEPIITSDSYKPKCPHIGIWTPNKKLPFESAGENDLDNQQKTAIRPQNKKNNKTAHLPAHR